jgi:acyl-CoA thioester hydrolase
MWTRSSASSSLPSLPGVHRTTIHVRWAELDPYHHVNHATYLSYLEHARISALEHIGSGMDALAAQGVQVVVVRVEVRFVAPARAGDELVISSSVTSLGASASTWSQRIDRGSDRILEATVEAAATDMRGKPIRMPASLRSGLATLLEGDRT